MIAEELLLIDAIITPIEVITENKIRIVRRYLAHSLPVYTMYKMNNLTLVPKHNLRPYSKSNILNDKNDKITCIATMTIKNERIRFNFFLPTKADL